MTRNEFIAKVAVECVENEISLKIIQKAKINDYLGWFDSNKKELVCAYKSKIGFQVLIHEYHHFIQWKYYPDFWNKCNASKNGFLNWIEGEEMSKHAVTRGFNQVVELERDCEIRSIQCIKKLNLDVDIHEYAKEANAYLYSYLYVKKHRHWPKSRKNVLEFMPTEILPLENYKKGIDKNGNSVMFLYENSKS